MIKQKIKLLKGDITQLEVDAIVNAANTSLLGGGGVDGAIHRAAGSELLEECKTLGGCATGQAKVTKGYQLPAKYIIHTVGPVWRGGAKGEAKQLSSCYVATFKLALEHKIKTIAFPAVSCGIYGFPIAQAALIAVKETANFLEQHPEMEAVDFVCFSDEVYEAYQQALSLVANE